MSSAAFLVFAVSGLAGTFLRAGAFVLVMICVVCAVCIISTMQGETVLRSLLTGLKLLVLMQVSYALGLFLSHAAGQMLRRRKRRPLAESAQMGEEPPTP